MIFAVASLKLFLAILGFKEVSRRHKISLTLRLALNNGGKWRSYRRMAEETIDR
jgi:hypothetical protein